MNDFKKALFIEANRTGYGPDQCSTVTIGELIQMLQEQADAYGEDCEVYLRHDRGYTYGGIRQWDLSAGCYDGHGTYDDLSDEFAEVMGWSE